MRATFGDKLLFSADEELRAKQVIKRYSYLFCGAMKLCRPGSSTLDSQHRRDGTLLLRCRVRDVFVDTMIMQDAGDIAKVTKEAGDKVDLQAKYRAAENLR